MTVERRYNLLYFSATSKMKTYRLHCLLPLMFIVAITAGCGKGDGKPAATQVAAKVNSDEITVHQIDSVLARTPNVTPEVADRAKRAILDKLVDQQLARQQAIDKKLDRSPPVLQALEAAKTEILARAYVEQIAAAQPKPTDDEVKKYYGEHPELFAQRRLFNVEEIVLAAQGDTEARLREQITKARSIQEVAAWLKAQGVQFQENRGARAAEQIPFWLLSKLQSMKDGDMQLIGPVEGRLEVIRVVASKAAPVDEKAATPAIRQFLFNQRSSEAVAKEMKLVKEKAKIEYVGAFATTAAAPEAKPAAPTEKPAATPETAAKADAAKPADAQPQGPDLAKGIRGIR